MAEESEPSIRSPSSATASRCARVSAPKDRTVSVPRPSPSVPSSNRQMPARNPSTRKVRWPWLPFQMSLR